MSYKKRVAVASSALLIAVAAVWPATAEAQTRGRGRGGRSVVVVRGYYGSYFGPFGAFYGWSPYAFGYAPYGFAPYGYAPYGGRGYDDSASARVQVKPKETEVYVDGYLAGVADDFDGTFQRLHLRPGGHEITLFLDGHRFHWHKAPLDDSARRPSRFSVYRDAVLAVRQTVQF